MEINQDSFIQVRFAESLHRGIKRLMRAFRAQELLTQKLEAAKKEKESASDFIGKNLVPLSDDELKIMAQHYPDVSRFIDTLIKSRSEGNSENGEVDK